MAVKYGFYDSINKDRVYSAVDMTTIFDGIICDGIFRHIGKAFAYSKDALELTIQSGRAWFAHSWVLNTSNLTITLPNNSTVLVGIEINRLTRTNAIKYVTVTDTTTTTPSGYTTPLPSPDTSENLAVSETAKYFYPLYRVITQNNVIKTVTDLRGSSACPWAIFADQATLEAAFNTITSNITSANTRITNLVNSTNTSISNLNASIAEAQDLLEAATSNIDAFNETFGYTKGLNWYYNCSGATRTETYPFTYYHDYDVDDWVFDIFISGVRSYINDSFDGNWVPKVARCTGINSSGGANELVLSFSYELLATNIVMFDYDGWEDFMDLKSDPPGRFHYISNAYDGYDKYGFILQYTSLFKAITSGSNITGYTNNGQIYQTDAGLHIRFTLNRTDHSSLIDYMSTTNVSVYPQYGLISLLGGVYPSKAVADYYDFGPHLFTFDIRET